MITLRACVHVCAHDDTHSPTRAPDNKYEKQASYSPNRLVLSRDTEQFTDTTVFAGNIMNCYRAKEISFQLLCRGWKLRASLIAVPERPWTALEERQGAGFFSAHSYRSCCSKAVLGLFAEHPVLVNRSTTAFLSRPQLHFP